MIYLNEKTLCKIIELYCFLILELKLTNKEFLWTAHIAIIRPKHCTRFLNSLLSLTILQF